MTQVEIRLPELAGGTEAEQLRKIQSYLYSLAAQLQFAFDGVVQTQSELHQSAKASDKQTQTGNFAQLKSLIVRSAEITEHLSQQVEKKLSGSYVAQSQFGIFQQETEQRLIATDEQIRQEFVNFQQISSDLEEVRSSVLEVNASIRTGLLDYQDSGEPVYGVEIGQQVREDEIVRFHKFARLTAQKLSFFDSGGVEVAYVSDRKLHVTEASVWDISAQTARIREPRMGDYIWVLGSDGHLSLQ